jgi:hypothetical protein
MIDPNLTNPTFIAGVWLYLGLTIPATVLAFALVINGTAK